MKTKSSIENRSVGLLGPAAGVFIHSYFAMGVQSQAIKERISKLLKFPGTHSSISRWWLRFPVVVATAVATLLLVLIAALFLAAASMAGLVVGTVALAWVLPRRLQTNPNSSPARPADDTKPAAARTTEKRLSSRNKNHESANIGVFVETNA